MAKDKGSIVLMGSGELTATMVDVHKELLRTFPHMPRAVFIDTPAGFQLNADQISKRAQDYFQTHVQQTMSVASFKSKETPSSNDAEQAFHALREADYILIGPGSPTYTLRQLQDTPIPEILNKRIESGGSLVAASAAALTVGRYTLPVYEIYKVGEDPHWVEGLDLLGHFGFNLAVVPHWNNAEGGNHDTRFCFMGEPRFRILESVLPDDVTILGLDEHTACIFDLGKGEGVIRGIGSMVLRRGQTERVFQKGDTFPLDLVRGEDAGNPWLPGVPVPVSSPGADDAGEDSFWDAIHALETTFHEGLDRQDSILVINTLLEFDRVVWNAQQDLENEESISQARETLRELIVSMAAITSPSEKASEDHLSRLVEEMLLLREEFRRMKQFKEADAIRDSLQRVNIVVEDTSHGSRWRHDGDEEQ
jgi:peptidase E